MLVDFNYFTVLQQLGLVHIGKILHPFAITDKFGLR